MAKVEPTSVVYVSAKIRIHNDKEEDVCQKEIVEPSVSGSGKGKEAKDGAREDRKNDIQKKQNEEIITFRKNDI